MPNKQNEFDDSVLAKLFGFPKCCVDFYITASDDVVRNAPGFGGYRLCPQCSKKSLEDVVNDLATRRICEEPFPFAPSKESYQRLLNDPRFSESEQEWLARNPARVIAQEKQPSEAALLVFHEAMTQLNDRFDESIKSEPARADFFRAEREISQGWLTRYVLDNIYTNVRKRILEQMADGDLPVQHNPKPKPRK